MPYHVRITTKSDRNRDEVKLDLTLDRLQSQFLVPYNERSAMFIGGKTVMPDDIDRIRITETKETSEKLLPIVREERRTGGGFIGVSDEWYVANRGKDVTDEFITGPPGAGTTPSPQAERSGGQDPRKVFVIYGRNQKARNALFTFLRSIGLAPLEWSEAVAATGKGSPYIGEVLDRAFSIGQAIVVLLTPDDEARLRQHLRKPDDPAHETTLTPQARPNVLFEAGMAMSRSPNRTVLVELDGLRPFSDIAGRHVVKLDNTTQRRQDLAQRLQAAGCAVSLSGTDWQTSGDFEDALAD